MLMMVEWSGDDGGWSGVVMIMVVMIRMMMVACG